MDSKPIKGDVVYIGKFNDIEPLPGDNFGVQYVNPTPNAEAIVRGKLIKPFDISKHVIVDGTTFKNPDATNKANLWIVGDSYTESLEPYLFGMFENIQMYHHQVTRLDELEKLLAAADPKPQYALIVLIELHM